MPLRIRFSIFSVYLCQLKALLRNVNHNLSEQQLRKIFRKKQKLPYFASHIQISNITIKTHADQLTLTLLIIHTK